MSDHNLTSKAFCINVINMEFKSPAIHRTPLYRAKSSYLGMKARCLNANGKNPTYANVELRMSLEEWLAWAIPEYEKFNNNHPDETPHASRFKDSGHYEIGNIRIITHEENNKELAERSPRRIVNGGKRCSQCERVKALDLFPKSKNRTFGYGYVCKECCRENNKTQWDKKHPNQKRRKLMPIDHGTYKGLQTERRRKLVPCVECLKSGAEYMRKRRATRAS